MKIVELDGYAAFPGDINLDDLKQFGEFVIYDRTPVDEIVSRSKDADAILINKVQITDEIMAQLPHLKYIGVMATGYNVVDIESARRRGIIVTNIPSYSTDSVAQMVFAHILTVTNRVEHYAQKNREGSWSKNPDFCYWDTPLIELAGKTLGIVGLGNIGMRVARIAHEFGMDVFAVTSKNASDLADPCNRYDKYAQHRQGEQYAGISEYFLHNPSFLNILLISGRYFLDTISFSSLSITASR